MRIRRLLAAGLVLGIVTLPALTIYPRWHRDALNRQVITAIKHKDIHGVLAALNAGGDANTRDFADDVRSSFEHLHDLALHRSQPAFDPKHFATALELLFEEATARQDARVGAQGRDTSAQAFLESACHLLLELGANPNLPANRGATVLGKACEAGNLRCVRDLVRHGADVNGAGIRGQRPLMAAYDRPEIVTFLLENGADPYRRNKMGLNAFRINNGALQALIVNDEKNTREYKNLLRVHDILEKYRRQNIYTRRMK